MNQNPRKKVLMIGASNQMVKYLIMVVVTALMTVLLTGCGANFVAADKNLGIPAGKKPVVGVIVSGFTVNTEGNPLGAILGAKLGEQVTQSLKDEGIDARVVKYSEVQTHQQLATSMKKYDSLPTLKKWVDEHFLFSTMNQDFNDLGIDMLVIISGSANNASTPIWVDLATFAVFGSVAMTTPSTVTFVTSVNKEGKPLYNERTIFSRMGRRDFGDDGHRKAMTSVIADGIREKSF